MKRLPDWRPRLAAYVSRVARARFRPGKHDCTLFAAGGVQAQTGVDLARGWRGYRTLSEGLKHLEAKGYEDHVALVADLLPEVPPAFAREGDIAVVEGGLDQSVGIVQGPRIYVLRPGGIGLVPLGQAVRAFRV